MGEKKDQGAPKHFPGSAPTTPKHLMGASHGSLLSPLCPEQVSSEGVEHPAWGRCAMVGPHQRPGSRPHLVFPELVDNGLVEQEPDVLEEVKGAGRRGALVHLLLVLGLVGINTLQDAQASGGQMPFMPLAKGQNPGQQWCPGPF